MLQLVSCNAIKFRLTIACTFNAGGVPVAFLCHNAAGDRGTLTEFGNK